MVNSHKHYKKTKIGKIPSDWNVESIQNTVRDTTLGTNQVSNSNDGVPLMKMGNLNWGEFVFKKVEFIDKDTAKLLNNYELKVGDFLFNTRNTPELVGKSAVWKERYGKALYNNNLLKIDFKKNVIYSTDFVSCWMNSYRGRSQLKRLVSGTTSVAAIYWKDLKKYLIPIPSLAEQQKIAKILSTVDNAIEKTDVIIEETQQLKKGLMEKLFAEGIGHTRFKKTKIGRISTLENVCLGFTRKITQRDTQILL